MFFDSTSINKALFNSARGMVIVEAHGKAFALLVTKDVWISPDFETKSKYITVAYIFFEASEKLCNSTFVNESLTLLKQYFLGLTISFNS